MTGFELGSHDNSIEHSVNRAVCLKDINFLHFKKYFMLWVSFILTSFASLLFSPPNVYNLPLP